jgi:hypothetical protein
MSALLMMMSFSAHWHILSASLLLTLQLRAYVYAYIALPDVCSTLLRMQMYSYSCVFLLLFVAV